MRWTSQKDGQKKTLSLWQRSEQWVSFGACTNIASVQLKFQMELWLMSSLRVSNRFGKYLSIRKVDAGILGLIKGMRTKFGRTFYLASSGSSLIAVMKSLESYFLSLTSRIRLVFGWNMAMKLKSKKEWSKTSSGFVSCPQTSDLTFYFFSHPPNKKRKRNTQRENSNQLYFESRFNELKVKV